MENAIKEFNAVDIEINELFNYVSGFCDSALSNQIKELLNYDTENPDFATLRNNLTKLYDAFEIMCLVISEREQSSEQIGSSLHMKNIKVGDFFNKLDALANTLYRMAKKNPELETKSEKAIRAKSELAYEHFGVNTDIFQMLNAEFLLPTEEYFTKDNLPKNATIVQMSIKNTQNLVMNIRPLIDRQYIKSQFPHITPTVGVTQETVDRYKVMTSYKNFDKAKSVVELNSTNIFQDLGDGYYRKLVHFPENDYVRNYNFMPLNQMVTDFENKRILLSRQKIPKSQLYTPIDDAAIGKIKKRFIADGKKMADALFESLYTPNMTDEQVIKLGISSYIIQESLTKDYKYLINNFNKSVNRRVLKSLL